MLLNQLKDSSYTALKSQIIFCHILYYSKPTLFARFSLESKRTQASIYLQCKSRLSSCVILSHGIVTTNVLKEKKEKVK